MSKDSKIAPFRAIGYNKTTYYYYVRGSQTVVALTAKEHSKLPLLELAPFEWWKENYPDSKNNIVWEKAASSLMASNQKHGIFTIDRIRGRGVWYDGKELAIHYGDRVTIDDKDYRPSEVGGKYMYENTLPLEVTRDSPLSDEESKKLIAVFKKLKFATQHQHIWLTGWIVCAMISGALGWRPHMWLSGAAQCGKSTVASLIRRILGDNSLFIQSVSTEAGIRQKLGADALPIIFDEAEREDSHSHGRIQSILTLARQASSNNDGLILKGTTTGKALQYLIRSCFFLSSINTSLIQTADKGRFSVVEIIGKLLGQEYKDWVTQTLEILHSEYRNKLYNRIIKFTPVILENAEIFATAIEKKTGDRRLGDQYGALLAGFRLLETTSYITDGQADEYINKIEFTFESEMAAGRTDEFKLLQKLQEYTITIWEDKQPIHYTLSDACRIYDDKMQRHLRQIGVVVREGYVLISNTSTNFAQILSDTVWHNEWAVPLKRIENVIPWPSSVKYAGTTTRATAIPVSLFCDEEPERQSKLEIVT